MTRQGRLADKGIEVFGEVFGEVIQVRTTEIGC